MGSLELFNPDRDSNNARQERETRQVMDESNALLERIRLRRAAELRPNVENMLAQVEVSNERQLRLSLINVLKNVVLPQKMARARQ